MTKKGGDAEYDRRKAESVIVNGLRRIMRSIRLSSAIFNPGRSPRFRTGLLVRGNEPRRALRLDSRVDRAGLGLPSGGERRSGDVEGRGG